MGRTIQVGLPGTRVPTRPAGREGCTNKSKNGLCWRFLLLFASFYPLQYAFFTNRLSTPFLIPFSHKPSIRGVDESGRNWTV